MKAYIKNERTTRFLYSDEMEKILAYLSTNGKIQISEEMVESLYQEYSEEKFAASWMTVDDEIIERFADWLSEKEI